MKKEELFIIVVNDRYYFSGLSEDKTIRTTKYIVQARCHKDYAHAQHAIHGFPDLGRSDFYRIEKIFVEAVNYEKLPESISYEEAAAFDLENTNNAHL